MLEECFTCLLVNAAHVKKVPGRKTDVLDCAWIAQLLEHGLSWFSVKMTAVGVVLRRTRGSPSPIATRMVPAGPGASRVTLAALGG